MSTSEQALPSPIFATTHWTRVLQARGNSADARAALSDLCAAYYTPVHAFVRRAARDEETARDATQEFFTRLLTRQGIDTVEQGRGRFRSFLLGAVKHFLADERDRAQAAKRGGGQETVPIEIETDTSPGLELADVSISSPDLMFDRQWALTLLDRALRKLAGEHAADESAAQHSGESNDRRTVVFETLKPWLTGLNGLSQGEAAAKLGMTEGAVKGAVHRLRRRFRELVRAEISQTVSDPAQVQEEMRYLIEVLS